MSFKIGDRVRVRNGHQWRSDALGVVEAIQKNGRALVRFDDKGIGFDGGVHLVLGETDFTVVRSAAPKKRKA